MNDKSYEAQALIGGLAGISVEPAAATSVAAAQKLRAAGVIGPNDIVVCNLTGHGLKQPEVISFSEKKFAPIAPTSPGIARSDDQGGLRSHGLIPRVVC